MRILDLGSGVGNAGAKIWPEATEVVRVDLNPEVNPDVVADVRSLPEDLGEFDKILASHVLEHLGRKEAVPALKHWVSFLKPGGEMHVIVPDLEWAVEQLSVGKPDPTVYVIIHIYGGQDDEFSFHKMGYTALLLRHVLDQAGLQTQSLRDGEFYIVMDDREPVKARQLYAMAVKP